MEERERERESNVGLPKEGAFSVEVAETFVRCDTQNMWAFLFSNIDKERRFKGTDVVGRYLDSMHPLHRIRKVDICHYSNRSNAHLTPCCNS